MRPIIGVIGAGNVGETLARLLSRNGYQIGALYSRSPERGELLSARVGAVSVESREAVIAMCDLTLLTVPDDVIQEVAESINTPDAHGKAIVHTSGAHDSTVLQSLAGRGAWVGSLHPAYPFADVERSVAGLRDAAFAIEAADPTLHAWLVEIVGALQGHVLDIPLGKKAVYHAAMVMASNYTVTLYAIAERLLLDLGAQQVAADAALNVLLTGTLENLRAKHIPDALTGPLVRADVGTLKAHLAALRGSGIEPQLGYLYTLLAQLSYPMLEARQVDLTAIKRVFEEMDIDHETDST